MLEFTMSTLKDGVLIFTTDSVQHFFVQFVQFVLLLYRHSDIRPRGIVIFPPEPPQLHNAIVGMGPKV